MNTGNNDIIGLLIKIREHAVREFAEKLKEQAFECDISFGLGSQRIKEAVAVDDIDKTVNELYGNNKELKGEENAEVEPC